MAGLFVVLDYGKKKRNRLVVKIPATDYADYTNDFLFESQIAITQTIHL